MGFFNFGKTDLPSPPTKRVDVKVTNKGLTKMRQNLLEPFQFEIISIVKKFDQCNSDDVARNLNPPRNIDMIRAAMRDMEANGLIEIVG